MTVVRLLIFLMIHHCVFTQEMFSQSVSLSIEDDSLACEASCKTLSTTLVFSNDSNEDILLYGLGGGPYPAPFNLSKLCDVENIGTAIAFAIYREDGTQKMPEIIIGDKAFKRPVTRQMLDSALQALNEDFLKSKRLLLKDEKISFRKELSLADLHLQAGLYYVEVIYYSGNKIFNVLDYNEVKKTPAKLFQGCAKSNKIPFVVK